MAPIYKKALIIGATSGIGEALAAKLTTAGTSVIATGRRQDRLDALVAAGNAAAGFALDITDLAGIPAFAHSVLAAHPDIDCIVLNSGIQRAFDFAKPGTVDLAAYGEELSTNYTAYVHLVAAFLPHLQALVKQGGGEKGYLVFISATLGLVPSLVRTPGYNASKAALHSFITVLRQQLVDGGYGADRLRVVEVLPPAVQTELHDAKHQPDLVDGGQIGMPLGEFTDELYAELARNEGDVIGIGHVKVWLGQGGFEAERQRLFEEQQGVVKNALSKFLKK